MAGSLHTAGKEAGKPGGNILPDLAGAGEEAAAMVEGMLAGMAGIEGSEGDPPLAPASSEAAPAPVPTATLVLTAITLPIADHDPAAQMAGGFPEPRPAPAPQPASVPPLAQMLQASIGAQPQAMARGTDGPARPVGDPSAAEVTSTPATERRAAAPGFGEQPPGPAQAAPALRASTQAPSPAGKLTTAPDLPAPAEAAQRDGEAPANGARSAANEPAETAEALSAQPLRTAAIARTAELAADLAPGLAEAAAPPAPVAGQAATPASANPAPAAPATPALSGPQDFQTLVDRLAEAREAASPRVVSAALSTAEFGRISLAFRHDERALSVGMSSNDPGFAPAVQAAVAATAGAQGQQVRDDTTSPNRQDTQAQAGAQQQAAAGQGEARQQSAAQSREQGSTQPGNPAAQSRDEAAPGSPDTPANSRRAGARGIYA